MHMNRLAVASLVLLSIAGQACADISASSQVLPTPPTPPVTAEYVPSAIPVTPTYEGCAYVWGTQDLPELSRQLNAELQNISMDLTGLAYAYGENCVYSDGRQTFSAMETDFRIGVKVKDVKDENALGEWIHKVMAVVLALPPDKMEGPNTGRVDFDFKQPDPAELFVTVPIDKYRQEADGLRGADLLHLFYSNP